MALTYDKVGVPITVGSYIVYGHALGRCAGLRIGKVLSVAWGGVQYGSRVAKIIVWGVDDDWSHNAPELCQRAGTLMYPDRVVVLPDHKVPTAYVRLLADVALPQSRTSS